MLPQKWDSRSIESVYDFTKKPREIVYSEYDRVPFIPMEMVPIDRPYINNYNIKNGRDIRSGNYFEKGDVLLAKITPSFENGKQGIAKDIRGSFGVASTELIPIRGKKGISSKYFLFYYLLEKEVRKQIAQKMEGTTGRQRIPISVLKKWMIPFPPLKEQQKIAAVLFKIQQAIEVQESIIEIAQELKKSTMQHVFTYGLRGEKTKETEVGRVPENWSLKPAIEVFKLTSGKTRPENIADRKNHEAMYPVYGGNGVMGYSTKFFLSSKALVLGRVGEYCGVVHISHDKSWITDNALYSKEWLDNGTSIDYVALYLTFFDLNKLKRRSSQPLISQSIVYHQKIPIPDNQEQQKIVNILKSIDNKIKLHIGKKSGLQDLFKTVLNNLMTGEVRVKDLDINFSGVV